MDALFGYLLGTYYVAFFYFQSDFNLEVFLGEASSFRVSHEIAVLCTDLWINCIAGILMKLVNTKFMCGS